MISSDASREGKDPHKIDENFGQSLPENRILPDNDSICSDSEFGKFLLLIIHSLFLYYQGS